MAGFEVTPYGRFCLTPEDVAVSGALRAFFHSPLLLGRLHA
jgi:hypothetical protein